MSRSIDRVVAAGAELGVTVEPRRFPEGTKTAQDAARAIGCDVAQIVKSLVFVADGQAFLALTAGSNRADTSRLATVLGADEVRRADAEEARTATGFDRGDAAVRPSVAAARCGGPGPAGPRRSVGGRRNARRGVPAHARGPRAGVGRRSRRLRGALRGPRATHGYTFGCNHPSSSSIGEQAR
jgi:hypothetical protein